MNVIILAAGYGTRLQNDILSDLSLKYQHLIDVPKPLLPIKDGKPLISFWIEELEALHRNAINLSSKIYIVVNSSNESKFGEWLKTINTINEIKLIVENSSKNEERSGAIACIQLAIDNFTDKDFFNDVIVIAGDTLFCKTFNLENIVNHFNSINKTLLLYYQCSDEEFSKRGILETDEFNRVLKFIEKPNPNQTISRKACPCFYLIRKNEVPFIADFLKETADFPIAKRDAPGNFIKYLLNKADDIRAFEIDGRFDVGGLESYLTCVQYFSNE